MSSKTDEKVGQAIRKHDAANFKEGLLSDGDLKKIGSILPARVLKNISEEGALLSS